MNTPAAHDPYCVLTEPATLKIERVLPGPIERVWAYLTDSKLRSLWLAAGDMDDAAGTPIELVWRNDELSDTPTQRPAGFAEEQRMQCRIVEFDAPRKLVIGWQGTGDVSFELSPEGKDVLLTVIHRRIADHASMLKYGAGWHMHLDLLVAHATGQKRQPFWEGWARLHGEYQRRMPA